MPGSGTSAETANVIDVCDSRTDRVAGGHGDTEPIHVVAMRWAVIDRHTVDRCRPFNGRPVERHPHVVEVLWKIRPDDLIHACRINYANVAIRPELDRVNRRRIKENAKPAGSSKLIWHDVDRCMVTVDRREFRVEQCRPNRIPDSRRPGSQGHSASRRVPSVSRADLSTVRKQAQLRPRRRVGKSARPLWAFCEEMSRSRTQVPRRPHAAVRRSRRHTG